MDEETSLLSDVENKKNIEQQRNNFVSYITCFLTVIQFTTFSIFRSHLSKNIPRSSILFWSEVIKLSCSLPMTSFRVNYSIKSWISTLVPSIIYIVMNSLTLWATTYISASLYTILSNLKLVFTAILSYFILHINLSITQSLCLGLIINGCIGSAINSCTHMEDYQDSTIASLQNEMLSFSNGTLAVLGIILETFLSGLCSVYIQNLYENSWKTFWERNFQLSANSMILYSGMTYFEVKRFVVVEMYWSDLLIILTSALGGLLVGFSIFHADAIEKTIATSTAVCTTMIVESYIIKSVPSAHQILSCVVVLLGIFIFHKNKKK